MIARSSWYNHVRQAEIEIFAMKDYVLSLVCI
jgi:hypothetical protein